MDNFTLVFNKADKQLSISFAGMDTPQLISTQTDFSCWPQKEFAISLSDTRLLLLAGECHNLQGERLTAGQLDTRDAGALPQQLACLSGRFAVIVVDLASGCLQAYSDKFGALALFYLDNEHEYRLGTVLNVVSPQQPYAAQSLFNYFYFHTIPGPATVWQGAFKMEPASCLSLSATQAAVTAVYWQPQFAGKLKSGKAQLAAGLRHALMQATVAYRDQSTVGCFLSGGLDSSSVVACLAQQSKQPVKTFTIGFSEPGYDETAYAKVVADAFNTEHYVYYVTPDDIVQQLPQIAAYYQQPFGNSSALPTYFCARLAKQHGVDTMLAGDGGDELFSGNERYAKQMIFERFCQSPLFLRRLLAAGVRLGSRLLPHRLTQKANSFIEQSELDLASRLQRYNFLHQHAAEQVFSAQFLATVDTGAPLRQIRQRFAAAGAVSPVDAMLFNDWKFTLADNDLVKVNGMTELAGVNVVYPMLAQQVLNLSLQLPPDVKLTKNNLRDFYKFALSPILPAATIAKQKHGFGLPFGKWLVQHQPLQQLARQQLDSLAMRDIFRPDFIAHTLLQQQQGHAAYYGELIWVMMMLEFWLQQHSSAPAKAL
ncbi:asparagine synthetase B family protein [Rheinheimera sp. NSM]|uniref:asparagine synthetase B family protein n=1 Tax=Rheinheimera sp. NSM TaxID=3457884 RepID=UPI0040354382